MRERENVCANKCVCMHVCVELPGQCKTLSASNLVSSPLKKLEPGYIKTFHKSDLNLEHLLNLLMTIR